MVLFIDSSDLDEIKEALSLGVVEGVTTNPSLIKEVVVKNGGISFKEYVAEILKEAGRDKPVSLEVASTKASDMVKEAKKLYDEFNGIAHNVVIKIPVTTKGIEADETEGIKAIKELSDAGIPVNATLIMAPSQAYLAALAGAKYVSPFLGRVDDFVRSKLSITYSKGEYFNHKAVRRYLESAVSSQQSKGLSDPSLFSELNINYGLLSGAEVLASIKTIFLNYGLRAKIIAASIRNARQAEEALEIGADIVTLPYSVLKAMMTHPKSEEGIRLFVEDAQKINYSELFKS